MWLSFLLETFHQKLIANICKYLNIKIWTLKMLITFRKMWNLIIMKSLPFFVISSCWQIRHEFEVLIKRNNIDIRRLSFGGDFCVMYAHLYEAEADFTDVLSFCREKECWQSSWGVASKYSGFSPTPPHPADN